MFIHFTHIPTSFSCGMHYHMNTLLVSRLAQLVLQSNKSTTSSRWTGGNSSNVLYWHQISTTDQIELGLWLFIKYMPACLFGSNLASLQGVYLKSPQLVLADGYNGMSIEKIELLFAGLLMKSSWSRRSCMWRSRRGRWWWWWWYIRQVVGAWIQLLQWKKQPVFFIKLIWQLIFSVAPWPSSWPINTPPPTTGTKLNRCVYVDVQLSGCSCGRCTYPQRNWMPEQQSGKWYVAVHHTLILVPAAGDSCLWSCDSEFWQKFHIVHWHDELITS